MGRKISTAHQSFSARFLAFLVDSVTELQSWSSSMTCQTAVS
jgi:hypothetical protein